MADYSSSTVVGRALILPVLSCNDVYVIFEPHFKQNLSPGLTYYCTPRRNPPCWDESKLAAIFYWPKRKIFSNCCSLIPENNAYHVRPYKFPMNRAIIYRLSIIPIYCAIFLFCRAIYYTHFEITAGPCYLILTGSNWCDLFTNRTTFCFKLHLFPSQWGGYTKNKTADQIPRRV